MPDEKPNPYDALLEDNQKMHARIDGLEKELHEVLGMNRSLLGRINNGSQDTTPSESLDELGKLLDGGLKHGSKLPK